MKTLLLTTKIFLLILAGAPSVLAQSSSNPFELTPRIEQEELPQPAGDTSMTASNESGNPFDMITPLPEKTIRPERQVREITPVVKEIPRMSKNRRFLFIVFLTNLLILTVIVTLFRSYFQKTFRAFTNDKMLSQVFREREVGGGFPFFLLYGFSLFNAGLFIFLLLQYYNRPLFENNLLSLIYCSGGITGFLLLKHLLLSIVGSIFPVSKETSLYSFTILIFAIIAGLVLVPANLLIAYAPGSVVKWVIWGTLFILIIIYGLRYLRGLFIANKFIFFHKFHFLLYICTVEIAPVLILLKLILEQM